jgi:predicted RNA-binding protein with TRAM domain
MNVRYLLIAGAVAMSTAAFASAKTYEINIQEAAKAGDVQLQPGQYRLKVEGSQAVFTDSHNKSFTVPAKVENVDRKFAYTSIESATQGGTDTIQAIDLGDSSTQVKLGQ